MFLALREFFCDFYMYLVVVCLQRLFPKNQKYEFRSDLASANTLIRMKAPLSLCVETVRGVSVGDNTAHIYKQTKPAQRINHSFKHFDMTNYLEQNHSYRKQ